jgi:hypothetical protein
VSLEYEQFYNKMIVRCLCGIPILFKVDHSSVDEIRNLYRGPSIDASYQVSVHLAKRFRGEDLKKLANQKQELPVVETSMEGPL